MGTANAPNDRLMLRVASVGHRGKRASRDEGNAAKGLTVALYTEFLLGTAKEGRGRNSVRTSHIAPAIRFDSSPLDFATLDNFGSKVIDEAQTVESCGPDVEMSAVAVLVAQPFDCLLDLDFVLPFPKDHLAGVAPDARCRLLHVCIE